MQKNGTASLDNRLDSLKSSVKNLVEQGSERAGELKTKAYDVKNAVVENGGVAINRAGDFIKANPIDAIAGARIGVPRS